MLGFIKADCSLPFIDRGFHSAKIHQWGFVLFKDNDAATTGNDSKDS